MLKSYIILKIALLLDTKIEFTVGSLLKWLLVLYLAFFPFCYLMTCIKHHELVNVNKEYILHSWFLSPFLMLKEWFLTWWEAL